MNNSLPPGKKPDVKKKLVVTGDGGCGKVRSISPYDTKTEMIDRLVY